MVVLVVLAGLLRAAPLLGAEEPPARRPYKAVGAPAHPKVDVRWNRYYDYEEATQLLEQLAQAWPDFARLESLGKSYGGREMWLMTLADFRQEAPERRAGMWIDGGIHANEVQSVEAVLYIAWFLLESQPHNPEIARMLRERVFYLMPMLSPDARDAHFYEPNSTHTPRTGLRPMDVDRDGLFDEDGPNDLNGDGHITQMRVRDEHGRFKPHKDFPELLVPVEDGEVGQYTILGIEGYDVDGDGRVNEDGPGGYDPNRDWGWNWQPNYVLGGAYRYPFSIEENRMAAEAIMARPNIAAAQSFHNTGGMLLRPPAVKTDTMAPEDRRVFDLVGNRGVTLLPGYKYHDIANNLYEGHGISIDWMYHMRGIYAFTNELFTPYNLFRDPASGSIFSNPEALHRFNRYLLFGEGLVPWEVVDHPQYGKVEVGGLTKNWGRQPPSFLLEEECHRNLAFVVFQAQQMPLVRVRSVEIEPLGEGLLQVTAAVVNERWQPTHAAVDLKHRITPPNVVSLSGEGVTRIVAGLTSDDRFFLTPQEQRRDPARLRVRNIPGQSAVFVRWLLEGEGPFTVRVESVKGGVDERTAP